MSELDSTSAKLSSVFELDVPELSVHLIRLSSAHREVLFLRFWEDMSYAEIAVATDSPVGTVRSRLHYATAQLKSAISAVTNPNGDKK